MKEKRPIYILIGIIGTLITMGYFKPDWLTIPICFPEQYTYMTLLAYIGAFTILVFTLEVWGMIIALPFEIAFAKRKEIWERLFEPVKAAASIGIEIAGIIESLMALLIIFALIYAASGEWGTFVMLILIGSGMIFFSNYLRR